MDFNSSHCEPVIICNTSSCIIKWANNIECKIVTKDTVKKELLITTEVEPHDVQQGQGQGPASGSRQPLLSIQAGG